MLTDHYVGALCTSHVAVLSLFHLELSSGHFTLLQRLDTTPLTHFSPDKKILV